MVLIPLVQMGWDGVIGFTGCCNGFLVHQMEGTRLRLCIRWIVLKSGMAFVFRLSRGWSVCLDGAGLFGFARRIGRLGPISTVFFVRSLCIFGCFESDFLLVLGSKG